MTPLCAGCPRSPDACPFREWREHEVKGEYARPRTIYHVCTWPAVRFAAERYERVLSGQRTIVELVASVTNRQRMKRRNDKMMRERAR